MRGLTEMAIIDSNYKVNEPYFENRSYLEWLESFTIDETVDDDRRLTYHKLLKTLWDIPFKPLLGNDDDRAAEGLELRSRYNFILDKNSGGGNFTPPDVDAIFGECRVLEMLVALSMRMYDLMQDMGIYNSVSRWFWEIMSNVGFDVLNDDTWNESDMSAFSNKQFVRYSCEEIMQGFGQAIGKKGGWFFLEDWNTIEIWYQMHRYLKQYVSGLE